MKNKIIIKLLLLSAISIVFIVPGLCQTNIQRANEYNQAKGDFNPKPASASLYNLGLKAYEKEDLESAITFFGKAVDLDPEFVDAYYNLGAIYKKLKKYPYAINSFQKAVELESEDHDAIFELASCYMEDKNYLMAKKYFSSLPATFLRYNDVKASLDKINNLYTYKNVPQDQAQINTPEYQAMLLINTLGASNENSVNDRKNIPGEAKTEPQPELKAMLLVDTLTKPNEEAFNEGYRVVSKGLSGPTGIAKDTRGNIYIANFSTNRIERLTPDGIKDIFLDKIGLKGPVGLAIDENDNLFIANYGAGTIIRVTPNKEIALIASKLEKPYYLFYDKSSRKLFVTVQGNNSLVQIDTGSNSQPITSR